MKNVFDKPDPAGTGAAVLSVMLAVSSVLEFRESGHWEIGLYIALHLQAAVLFLRRFRPKQEVRPHWTVCFAVAASVLWPWLYRPAEAEPGVVPQVLFAGAMVLCLAASASLGNFYGVFPAVRGIRTTGLYGVVRHPIYASYCVLDLALLACSPTPWNACILVAGLPLIGLRIFLEERLLSAEPEYRAYRRAVRYRLLPWIC